jgi:hypothetical protein
MQRGIAANQQRTVPGVIETIADGLSLALARPLFLLIPMLLDLYYWAGWRISIESLMSSLSRRLLETDATGADSISRQLDTVGRSNIGWLLSMFVPSLLADRGRSKLYTISSAHEVSASNGAVCVLIVLFLIVLMALISSAYAVPIADAVLDRQRTIRQTINAVLIASVRLIGTLFASLGIGVLILGPVAVVSVLLMNAGSDGAALFELCLALFILIASVALWFAPEAIVVSEVGPFDAIKYSIRILREFFVQCLGLIAASEIIALGLGEIWARLADTAPGLLIGVIANAFIGTGLAIASIAFYSNRVRLLNSGLAD